VRASVTPRSPCSEGHVDSPDPASRRGRVSSREMGCASRGGGTFSFHPYPGRAASTPAVVTPPPVCSSTDVMIGK
jgi:hypothetical protein